MRWADHLEEKCALDRIEEKLSPACGSPYSLAMKRTSRDSCGGSGGRGGGSSGGGHRQMRRSLSMNDINNIIITGGDEDDEKTESLTNQSMDHRVGDYREFENGWEIYIEDIKTKEYG